MTARFMSGTPYAGTELEMQRIYDGKRLPEPSYDREEIFQLQLYTPAYQETHPAPYSLSLPASEEKLELARENLQVVDLNTAGIVSLHSNKTSLEDFLPIAYRIEDLNAFAYQIQKMQIAGSESQLERLKAALCAEMPGVMGDVMDITENLEQYEVLPEAIRTAKDYAEFLLERENICMDPRLEDYTDLDSFGEEEMRQAGVTETVYGFVLRQDRPIRQLPEHTEQIRLFSPLAAEMYLKDDRGEISGDFEEISQAELCVYFIATEEQLKEVEQERGMRMGGM